MIETNTEIIEFVNGNWIAITMFLGLLGGIAKLTKNKWDDDVIGLFKGLFGSIRGGKK